MEKVLVGRMGMLLEWLWNVFCCSHESHLGKKKVKFEKWKVMCVFQASKLSSGPSCAELKKIFVCTTNTRNPLMLVETGLLLMLLVFLEIDLN